MKLLFLGGTGNISAACATLLHQRGHEIIILSRGRTAVPRQYRALQADRNDLAAMRTALRSLQPDVVLNFIGFSVSELEIDFTLFQGVVGQYLFISSATVYEKPPVRLPITEDAPLGNAWWDYAQKKVACEHWLQQQYRETKFPITVVRPSHTYSHRWIPNPISSASYSFAARLEQGRPVFVHDRGETPWTLTATDDFAVGLVGLVGNKKAIGQAFHITSDEVLTWNQIYAEIKAAVTGRPVNGDEIRSGDSQIVKIPTEFICQIAPQLTGPLKGDKAHPGVFDNAKIKQFVPEFGCRKPFRIGIRESVEWLRAHPEQQNLNPQVDQTFEQVIAAWTQREGTDSHEGSRV